MKKDFTKEDIIKKHETNVKSAFTAYFLAAILGVIYIVRYLIKQEFDFHFSLSFTDMMLKLEHSGEISTMICIIAIAAFFIVGLILVISGWKMTGQLAGLGIMCVGVVLLLAALFIYNKPFTTPSR